MPTNANERLATERLNLSTLRPGYLVSLKTSVKGNVSYLKEEIEPDHKTRSGARKASWKTERTIADAEEHTKASQLRMKARLAIVSVCARSEFGLLCPEGKIAELVEAIKDTRRMVDAFNRRSKLTTVGFYVISGKIARDDVEAARAINSEMRELLKNMADGVKNMDVKKVRESANKTRSIMEMLQPEAAGKAGVALKAARTAARKIVKAGEDAAQEIDREAIKAITSARTAFLDLSEPDAAEEEPAPTRARAENRQLDLIEDTELTTVTGRTPSEAPAQNTRPKKGSRRQPVEA